MMGRDGRHCILTLVERVTGYVLIKKLSARANELNNWPRERLGFGTPVLRNIREPATPKAMLGAPQTTASIPR
ncbi:hypothetical protein [Piscinibacter sp. HJYY11]|uniref:hypothetical protein n=1 Tax=Piscinibacter sp. HJYY11 TaxID=2801333 RepID=UPI00191FFE40|nr:hypothetical protein [Piscinibacter sp. HJYY11]MBL0730730.1 hypothetical protein [Piscinibacter sp. HJYY11]